MSDLIVEVPKFTVGQYVKARLGGLCGDDILIEGEIEDCLHVQPRCSTLNDRFKYKIRGERLEILESALAVA